MLPSLDEARAALLFPKTAGDFIAAATDLERRLTENPGSGSAALAADLRLDLRSALASWVLEELIDDREIARVVDGLDAVIGRDGAPELVAAVRAEAEAIAASQTRRMCEKTRRGELATYWGHDYCTGMDHSLRRGARWVTSNPAKINLFRKENPEIWTRLLAEAKAENPGAGPERLISALFVKVTAINARALKPIADVTGGEYGFVCVQTNPKNVDDGGKMLEEILYWQDAYRRELGYDPINVVYKLPAVKAAAPVVEELVARGIRVCMTLNFTVSQHEIFADLIQRGTKTGYVVLMAGFLDDNVAAELEGLGIADAKRYARWAGVSVMRKSYANLLRRGTTRAAIMAAAIRGPHTINCCLTDRPDSPVLFTTMTEKIKEFDSEARALASEMEQPVPPEIMAVLEKSAIFNQAYRRDRLDLDGVADFVPLKAVLKVFVEAYEEIERSLS